MTYAVSLKKPAQKALAALGPNYQAATTEAIVALGTEPRPNGVVKMKGDFDGNYRIEVRGQIRVIYEIDDAALTVLVVAIGNRGDVYKK